VVSARPDRLLVVLGTATEVGKTWVGCRLLEARRAAGDRVAARKPAQSWDPAERAAGARTDAELLAAATGEAPSAVCPADRDHGVAPAPPMAAARRGLLVPGICPPSVPPGPSRLRVTLSAAHTDAQVEALLAALTDLGVAW